MSVSCLICHGGILGWVSVALSPAEATYLLQKQFRHFALNLTFNFGS